ncbi:hypothetical protein PG995_005607 [Apiospora arundinis]
MCRAADPLCLQKAPVFENLGRSLPYNPLPVPAIDNLLGQRFPPIPSHLSRVLFVPKHDNTINHLPIYEVSDAYRRAVKDAAPGSNGYRVSLWFMNRPKGDGTDAAEVRQFVNNRADHITVEERSLNPANSAVAVINLPTGRNEPTTITGPGETRRSIRVAPSLPAPISQPAMTRSVNANVPQFPTLVVDDATSREGGAQYQIRPVGPGSVFYQLVRYRPDPWGVGTDSEIAAVYHHAGPHLTHPVDHSEGVLLVPGTCNPPADVLAVAMVIVLLWYIRELDAPPTAKGSSLSKMLGNLRIGKGVMRTD